MKNKKGGNAMTEESLKSFGKLTTPYQYLVVLLEELLLAHQSSSAILLEDANN